MHTQTKQTLLIGFPYSEVLLSKKLRLILEKEEKVHRGNIIRDHFFCNQYRELIYTASLTKVSLLSRKYTD